MQNGGKSIPSSIDLSIYTPFPRHQGTIFSCVGWSVGYGALTIERAIQNGWTDRVKITNESSSALFLYNQIKIGNCTRGARISDALIFCKIKEIAWQNIMIKIWMIVNKKRHQNC